MTYNARVVLICNGFPHHGGPFEATLEYLENFTTHSYLAVRHPLDPVQEGATFYNFRSNAGARKAWSKRRLNKPPLTYFIDLFCVPFVRNSKVWITYNPLTAVRALLGKPFTRRTVILWSVDYVPVKSTNPFVQWVYRTLDAVSHKYVDQHWDISDTAVVARTASTGVDRGENHFTVPMGIWESAYSEPDIKRLENRSVAYFGNLNARNGIPKLMEIISLSVEQHQNLTFEVIGGGEMSDEFRAFANLPANKDFVKYHGFMKDANDAYKILGKCSIAIAPFARDSDSFTGFADPSKFKAYLAAALPTVSSDEPPNADELREKAGAIVISAESAPQQYIDALNDCLENSERWLQRSRDAFLYSQSFRWQNIISQHLDKFLIDEH